MGIIKEKIAFFDFCDTLVPFQSADAYVKYVIKHCGLKKVRIRRILYLLLQKFNLLNLFLKLTKMTHKELFLLQIKGVSYVVMDEMAKRFYKEYIADNLIEKTYNELKKLQQEGHRIVLVSGGYDLYLHYFAVNNNVKDMDVVATNLLFKNGVFTGKMDDDCMNENKVTRLERLFDKNKICSIAYSDSLSDLPLLRWVDEAYLVIPSSEKNKMKTQYNFKIFYI